MATKPRVLIAPLDWGLGHATRCIPLIRSLEAQGAVPVLAGTGRSLALLQIEFPHLEHVVLPDYKVRYVSSSMVINLAWQAPRIFWAIWQEYRLVGRLVRELALDAIISDNRFGCFSAAVPSVFITHQVNIKALFFSPLVNATNHWFMRRYNTCWIPDLPMGEGGLSGTLAHPLPAHPDIRHLGILSRMKPLALPIAHDYVVVLSGPEPQRSYLEAKIRQHAAAIPGQWLIIQGKPGDDLQRARIADHIEMVPFMAATDLNAAMSAARLIITRSGYSTLLDLAKIGRPALLVPTPGQTEQIYLAEALASKGVFYATSQRRLNLATDIPAALQCSGLNPQSYDLSDSRMEAAVKDLCDRLAAAQ